MANAELLAKIKAEIERRISVKKDLLKCECTSNTKVGFNAQILEDEELLSFLDTLEEKPVDADREEIIGLSIMAYLETHLKHDKSVVLRGVNKVDAREWIRRQIKRIKSEPINTPEGLDEAAEEYYKKAKKHLFDNSPIGDCRHAFKAGAKWAMKQFELIHAKDAIEYLKMED